MGTNVYFYTNNKEIKERYNLTWELTDEPGFGYKAHLGKRSSCWKPLFQKHNDVINSVVDILDIYDKECSSGLKLITEYDKEISRDEFYHDFVLWNKDDKKALSHMYCEYDVPIIKEYYFLSNDGFEFCDREFL